MKYIYSFLIFLSGSLTLAAQSSPQNYIRSRTMLHESDTTACLDNISYYDGLGRPSMNVQQGVTPNHANLITLQEYDAMGRSSKAWLPHVTSKSYMHPAILKNEVLQTYNGDSRPFHEPVYEDSPLNRIIRQYGTGDAWNTHPSSLNYLLNESGGVLSCKLYRVNTTGALVQLGNYEKNTLYVTKSTDEDGNTGYTFTNKQGRTVLTRRMNENVPHDTYYVYDDFGNQCFVLPPAYQDVPSLSLFGYQYKYDDLNRCIEKTLPGCQPVYYVYDRADLLAFSQDGVQRTRQEWTFRVYDSLNRMVVTGIIQTGLSREQLTTAYKEVFCRAKFVNSCSADLNKPDNLFGYDVTFLPGCRVRVLAVNYYDTYKFLTLECFKDNGNMDYVEDASFGIRYRSSLGLVTGGYVRQLDNLGKGELGVHYYDVKGREIQRRSALLPYRHRNIVWTKYNFTGQPVCVKRQHFSSYYIYPYLPSDPRGNNDQKEIYEYEYDHAGRLVRTYHTHNDGQRVLLSEAVFDNLGRIQEKRRHNGKDTIEYKYNIRNWMASIKSRGFTQELFYNTEGPANMAPCYNGNIAAIKYKQNGNEYWYRFDYNELNFLSSAYTYDNQGNRRPHYESYTYDKMGNITYLERGLSESKVDMLDIRYSGNRIESVSSRARMPNYDFGSMTYPNLSNASVEYYYDANGNLIKNLDKGIVSSRYNFLNLADTIQFQNGNQIINSYLADGRKVGATYKTYMTGIMVPLDSVYHGMAPYTMAVDEWDGHYMYHRRSGSPNYTPEMFMVQTPEGYIGADHVGIDSRRNYAYYYYVHDHLGNVRITSNSQEYYVDQSLEYYPSGVLFDRSTETYRQPYMFGGKELVSMHGLNVYDFNARMQDPVIPRFTSMDPLCEKYPWMSGYAYCGNNPVNFFDPDGRRQWPVNGTYKGNRRRHEDNFGAPRGNRTHQGVDINLGSGSQDLGTPVYATHTGTVTKVAKTANGDTDAGGNRVQITSVDGEVSTFYMHLETIGSEVKVGERIAEGDQIGTLGGSGAGKKKKYSPHLHYELNLSGEKVDPVISEDTLIDPQALIDGVRLPEISTTGQKTTLSPIGIRIPETILPEKID